MGRLEGADHTDEERETYLHKVAEESGRAAADLGGDTLWLGYDSNTMPTTDEFAARLEGWFGDEGVDLVITHWRGSMHPRHIATYDAVTQAVKEMRRKGSSIRLMVDVQPTNEKLVARALRIIEAVSGVDETEARDLLDRSGNDVKVAICAAVSGEPVDSCREELRAGKGDVAATIRRLKKV